MSLPLVLALLWLVSANVIGMFPSKHHHWPAAYGLIAVGLPILGWVYAAEGIWIALIVLAMAASILRWPVRFLLRWMRRVVFRAAEG
ncbi:MAG: DUF2484 family protein [Paracoccaceae bacterium]|nr:DUF2484 family protein [Paracoccaceae bacterium]